METAEKIAETIIDEAYRNKKPGMPLARKIVLALTEAGLLRERPLIHCKDCDFPLAATESCNHCGSVTAVLCLNCHPRDDKDKALVLAVRG